MQLLLFLALVILVVFVIFAKKESFPKKAKIGLLITIVGLLAIASSYELMQEHSSGEHRLVLNAFKQGKTLYCEGKEISSATFIYVSGTQSFIPNDKNENDKGVVIDMATCKTEH